MCSHSLLQGIFQTQRLNPCLLHCRQLLYQLSHQGSPADKGLYGQGYGFSSSHIWMWELATKKAGYQRTDASKLCWRRFLWVPWTARRSNQSILKEINPVYSLEGLVLELKLQYCGLPMWRANLLEKNLMLGKIEDRRKSGWQRMRWLDAVTNLMDMSLSKLQEIVKDREAWDAAAHGVTKSQTWQGLNNNNKGE